MKAPGTTGRRGSRVRIAGQTEYVGQLVYAYIKSNSEEAWCHKGGVGGWGELGLQCERREGAGGGGGQ